MTLRVVNVDVSKRRDFKVEGMAIRFFKGHGTENDFVLLPDPNGALELDASLVRALCNRRTGIGADGVIRVVRTVHSGLSADAAVEAGAEWFMDYRNADGSLAEMCGNGLRVFARYLSEHGLIEHGALAQHSFSVGTRAGLRGVRVEQDGLITTQLGPVTLLGESKTELGGAIFSGVVVDTGNPHLVCLTPQPVSGIDLSAPPLLDQASFPDGANVEFVNLEPMSAGEGTPLRATMRVYERGSGETRSCGTGAVATAAAVLRSAGRLTGKATVNVPGGMLSAEITNTDSWLTGPAELVASGEWLL